MEQGSGETGERGPARGARRDSLFLLTVVTSPDGVDLGNARVRNLSATGLMADCESPFSKGDRISMELRGVGRVRGTIAWVKADRVGIAFDKPIDPQLARKPVFKANTESALPDYLRTPLKVPRR